MPWLSKGELRRLLRDKLHAERRVDQLSVALAAEREANRVSERHWADMFLRRMQTFPLPKQQSTAKPAEVPELQPAGEVPGMDPGAVEATVAAGLEMGVSRQETIRLLRQQTP